MISAGQSAHHDHCNQRRHPRRAAATIELALLLPFLTFIFVAVVDFSRIFYYSVTITNCARNGALYGSNLTAADKSLHDTLEEAALADAVNLNPPPTVTSVFGADYVDCTVKYTFKTISSYPGIPSTMNLSRTVRMRQTAATQANP